MDFAYKFPAVRGTQAGKTFYTAMVPLRMLKKLFGAGDEYVLPEYRAQRRLNESRIPVIRDYIIDNRNTYVFSALAASIDGKMEFIPCSSTDLGTLEISIDSTFLINDGQHRIAAIFEAVEEDETLLNETISVVFFEDQGLARSQQMFTDLNKHAVRTSNSIAELYDGRDPLAVATREMVQSIPFLNQYTDKEKDNLGKLSATLFTLNMFYKANKRIAGRDEVDGELDDFIKRYWKSVTAHMIPWHEVSRGELKKVDLREQSIAAQAVLVQALGRVGRSLRGATPEKLESTLAQLETLSWSRVDPTWHMRTINANGRIMSNDRAITLTANAIKKHLSLALTPEEMKKENELTALESEEQE